MRLPLILLLSTAAILTAEPGDSASTAAMKVHVLRLRPGAVLIVGDAATEAAARLRRGALRDTALAAAGVAVAAVVAMGMAW